jgi:molybdopterin molybdotransferase
MLNPDEARAQILSSCTPLCERQTIPLRTAAGRVLAQDVSSDVDMPPFRKSAMDGFAMSYADLAEAERVPLACIGESRAGAPFQDEVPPGTCVEIYTGAEVPDTCDLVVMVEQTRREGDRVHVDGQHRVQQNICAKAEDLEVGRRVKSAGHRLSPTDLSVLAAVGCDPVPVWRRPRVTILTTGDELVPPTQTPGRGQIRETNTLHLAALAERAGAEVNCLGLVRDEPEQLVRSFGEALEDADVVLTTGGVSMGRYDLVAEAFLELGVEQVFHKVAIKPGKPLWFGKRDRTLVFALPGNPVSCLLDHEVFVRPALARLEGASVEEIDLRAGRWSGPSPRSGPRQQHLPVTLSQDDAGCDLLTPIDWSGSADIVGLSTATALAVVEAGIEVQPGDLLPYRSLYL